MSARADGDGGGQAHADAGAPTPRGDADLLMPHQLGCRVLVVVMAVVVDMLVVVLDRLRGDARADDRYAARN